MTWIQEHPWYAVAMVLVAIPLAIWLIGYLGSLAWHRGKFNSIRRFERKRDG